MKQTSFIQEDQSQPIVGDEQGEAPSPLPQNRKQSIYNAKLQQQYVGQFLRNSVQKERLRKQQQLEKSYLKNANIYYVIVFLIISIYFLDLHTDVVTTANKFLGIIINMSINKVTNLIQTGTTSGSSNIDLKLSELADFENHWIQLLIVASILLIVFFVSILIKEIREERRIQEQQAQIEQRRLKKSTCPKLDVEDYEFQSKMYTNKQLQELFKNEDYVQAVNQNKLQGTLWQQYAEEQKAQKSSDSQSDAESSQSELEVQGNELEHDLLMAEKELQEERRAQGGFAAPDISSQIMDKMRNQLKSQIQKNLKLNGQQNVDMVQDEASENDE